jgi:hypothetical protein
MKINEKKLKFNDEKIDVLENNLYKLDRKILNLLLKDQTTKENILWCSEDYIKLGKDFYSNKNIKINLITGANGEVIKPRIRKSKTNQINRIKDRAEVFTPSWVCNHQNNIIDNNWLEEGNSFNHENNENKSWIVNLNKIIFKEKTWVDYVKNVRLEVACGEAPYIVSRYDTVTGEIIEPASRIGMLDRKLRVINENVKYEVEWVEWAKVAFQSVYGYEWQGDSLLIARENLLYTFIDYYTLRFQKKPNNETLFDIATIISWNFWQMDGLKCVVPNSCSESKFIQYDLFEQEVTEKCLGCLSQNILKHNGKYCLIKDWQKSIVVRFVDSSNMEE